MMASRKLEVGVSNILAAKRVTRQTQTATMQLRVCDDVISTCCHVERISDFAFLRQPAAASAEPFPFPVDPFPDIRWTVEQARPLEFTIRKEADRFYVHQRHLAQVKRSFGIERADLRPNLVQFICFEMTTQPQNCLTALGNPLNFQNHTQPETASAQPNRSS